MNHLQGVKRSEIEMLRSIAEEIESGNAEVVSRITAKRAKRDHMVNMVSTASAVVDALSNTVRANISI
jgi:hypothetical protein